MINHKNLSYLRHNFLHCELNTNHLISPNIFVQNNDIKIKKRFLFALLEELRKLILFENFKMHQL